jgi:LPXTG-motif cell wall-anchored protein
MMIAPGKHPAAAPGVPPPRIGDCPEVRARVVRRIAGLVGCAFSLLAFSPGVVAARPLTLVFTINPKVTAAFTPSSVAPNGLVWLDYTIVNQNSVTTYTNLHFTATVPAGLSMPDAPNGGPMCNYNGSVVLSGTTITVQNVKLGPKETCVIPVHIKGNTAGTYKITTSKVFSNEATGNPASATLKVAIPATPKPTAKPTGKPTATAVATPTTVPTDSPEPTYLPAPGPTLTPSPTPQPTANPTATSQPVVTEPTSPTTGGDATPLLALAGGIVVVVLAGSGFLFMRRRRG